MSVNTLREKLADQEHDRWSRWMRYMFGCGTLNPDGTWTMPADKVNRWRVQAQTTYAGLTEREKESDRAEADNTMALIREYLPAEVDPVP
jgi:hypothetical protein